MKNFFQAAWLRSKFTAVLYWIFISFLFVLPGSALPKANWLTAIYFDKWVHIGFFTALLFLFFSAFEVCRNKKQVLIILSIFYGFLVEVVQHFWVANRSFDVFDLVADTVGCFTGLLFWLWVYKKNKPL